MSSVASVVTRCLISLIHVSIGIAAGLSVIYSMVRWGSMEGCLPPMVQLSGGTFKMKHQLPDLCDCAFICLTVVAFLNLAMCAFVNCIWKYHSNGFLLVNMFLTLAVAGFSLFVASLMTTYRMIWCDVINQRVSKDHHMDCADAATEYARLVESGNMTVYYDRLEVQMLGLWALVPLTVVIIFLYGIALNVAHKTPTTTTIAPEVQAVNDCDVTNLPPTTPPPTGNSNPFDDAVSPDETTPLLYGSLSQPV